MEGVWGKPGLSCSSGMASLTSIPKSMPGPLSHLPAKRGMQLPLTQATCTWGNALPLGMLTLTPETSSPTPIPSPGAGPSTVVAAPWSPHVAGWWLPDSSWYSIECSHKRPSGHPLGSCDMGRYKWSVTGDGKDRSSQKDDLFCNHQLNVITILCFEHLLYVGCWTENSPGIKYYMPIGAHPCCTHFI